MQTIATKTLAAAAPARHAIACDRHACRRRRLRGSPIRQSATCPISGGFFDRSAAMYAQPAFNVHRAVSLAFAAARGFGLVVACDRGRPVASLLRSPVRIDWRLSHGQSGHHHGNQGQSENRRARRVRLYRRGAGAAAAAASRAWRSRCSPPSAAPTRRCARCFRSFRPMRCRGWSRSTASTGRRPGSISPSARCRTPPRRR